MSIRQASILKTYVFVLALIVFHVAFPGWAQESEPTSKISATLLFIKKKIPEMGCQISYPKPWVVTPIGKGFRWQAHDDFGRWERFMVILFPAAPSPLRWPTAKDYAQGVLEQLDGFGAEVTAVTSFTIPYKGRDVNCFQFTRRSSYSDWGGTGAGSTQWHVVIPSPTGDLYVNMVFTCETSELARFQPLFKRILESFTFISGTK